jgi:biopolymer transport protein ExbB
MESLMDIFIGNLWKFDIIIFILAFINFWCFIAVRSVTSKLYKKMYYTIFVPSHRAHNPQLSEVCDIDETDIISLRKRSGVLYNIFSILTSLFTMLGILGTVISLIPMVEDMDVIKANFFVALTSTFWGLVFAVIFKIFDASVSGRIDDNEKTVALFLERNAKSIVERK